MRPIHTLLAAVLFVGVAARGAAANDSMAEVAIGGLVLKESAEISLDREDLYLSQDEVRVDYLFTNTGPDDITALVAFPLPDQDYGDDSQPSYIYKKDLDFRTTVDGKPVAYDLVEQAIIDGRNVDGEIAEFGLSAAQDFDTFDATVRKLSPGQQEKARALGLIRTNDLTGENLAWLPGWKTRTLITRKQVFPAGKTVAVKHRYKPLAGGSVGGALTPGTRTRETLAEYEDAYCIDKPWLAAFDRSYDKWRNPNSEYSNPYEEIWLRYVLSSGANWKGPIKDFRLVVDKGKASNLVSFCAEGVRKIAPTQFEVRKTNFEPEDDLRILIVKWFKEQQ